jgi:hypothetical protein
MVRRWQAKASPTAPLIGVHMHHLGISVYPEHSTPEADEAYLKLASEHGFDRLFTCLLSVKKSREDTLNEFGKFVKKAHSYGFSVAVDTNPTVFKHLGATALDLRPFAQMNVDIIRLDGHLGDFGDIVATQNPYGIAIQFNASSNLALDLLIERGADSRNMCVCHNFYPERYTGLGEGRFKELSKKYHDMGLPTAAFISSRQPNTFGPWDVFDGLPTCEEDRTRPIDLQARHLLATGLVDNVLVGNCFASEEELTRLASLDLTRTTMRVSLEPAATKAEIDELWMFDHFTRTDASDYLLRSSLPRLRYREVSIPSHNLGSQQIRRGDVLIVNDNLEHYRGEVEVALRDFPDDGTRNIVARIPKEEQFLLDYIKPEHRFGFIKP